MLSRVNRSVVATGLIFCGVGAATMWEASGYGLGSALEMGAGYFPFFVATALATIGLAKIASAVTAPGASDFGRIAWRPLFAVASGVVACALLLPVGGLVITVAATVLLCSLASTGMRARETVILIVVVEIICVSIFYAFLPSSIKLWPFA